MPLGLYRLTVKPKLDTSHQFSVLLHVEIAMAWAVEHIELGAKLYKIHHILRWQLRSFKDFHFSEIIIPIQGYVSDHSLDRDFSPQLLSVAF